MSADFAPTAEQAAALDLFSTGRSLAIEAGAGTGKTSTLRLLAESTDRRGQYIAFNKAIVTEAGAKMPGTVTCSTAHSLAFRAVGRRYGERLRNSRRMRSTEIARRLGLDPVVVRYGTERKVLAAGYLAGLAMRAVTKFCQSADLVIDERHVPYVDGIDEHVDGKRGWANNREVRAALEPALKIAWDDLMDVRGALPFKHDHYLKAWHLEGPRIGADYILFDEAQDANPVMVAIVSAQRHAQLVWVGDSQQQIYTFTGAVNALATVPADQRAYLTQSFRFGPAIADLANVILDDLGADLRLTGTPTIASVVGPVAEPHAVLCRTNATAVRTCLNEQAQGRRPHLVGGGAEVAAFARAAGQLMDGVPTEHPELACFTDWEEVLEYVDHDEQGSELRLMVKLVEEFGVDVILEALDRMAPEDRADVIVSTAHKSKGREWPTVTLAGDFPDDDLDDEDRRLLYVAITRARLELDVTAVDALDDAPDRPAADVLPFDA